MDPHHLDNRVSINRLTLALGGGDKEDITSSKLAASKPISSSRSRSGGSRTARQAMR
jgi:hypothetical protein